MGKRRAALILCLLCAGTLLSTPARAAAASVLRDGGLWLRAEAESGTASASVEYEAFQLYVQSPLTAVSGMGLRLGMGPGKWGPGRSGGLVLGGVSRPLPLVGYTLETGKSEYVRFVAFLGDGDRRRLFGHRLEYSPAPDITLGISETAVGYGALSPVLYWPFPGLPLYALQRAAYQADPRQDSLLNMNIGADFSVRLPGTGQGRPSLEFWGELLVDDAQSHTPNRGRVPDMVALLAGTEVGKLGPGQRLSVAVEYVRIANHVYSHKGAQSDYRIGDAWLGHPLGPDADMLRLSAVYSADHGLTLGITAALERRGEGRDGRPWSGQSAAGSFPSGVVERASRISAEADLQRGPAAIRLELGVTSMRNSGNTAGERTWSAWAALLIGMRL